MEGRILGALSGFFLCRFGWLTSSKHESIVKGFCGKQPGLGLSRDHGAVALGTVWAGLSCRGWARPPFSNTQGGSGPQQSRRPPFPPKEGARADAFTHYFLVPQINLPWRSHMELNICLGGFPPPHACPSPQRESGGHTRSPGHWASMRALCISYQTHTLSLVVPGVWCPGSGCYTLYFQRFQWDLSRWAAHCI